MEPGNGANFDISFFVLNKTLHTYKHLLTSSHLCQLNLTGPFVRKRYLQMRVHFQEFVIGVNSLLTLRPAP